MHGSPREGTRPTSRCRPRALTRKYHSPLQPSTSMLKLDNLYKVCHPGTPNEVRALRGVSLGLEPGSFLLIIGTNGSGKSTLLNAVAGTFVVDTGRITLAGHDIT